MHPTALILSTFLLSLVAADAAPPPPGVQLHTDWDVQARWAVATEKTAETAEGIPPERPGVSAQPPPTPSESSTEATPPDAPGQITPDARLQVGDAEAAGLGGRSPTEESATAGDEARLPFVAPAEQRRTPPQIVAEAVRLPDGGTVTGRPLTLLEALSSVRDRLEQLQVTHAYWRLTKALAEYRCCFDEQDRLGRLQGRPEDAMTLRTARASAAAALRAAELAALTAQYDLAEAAMLPPDGPLPVCADLPHVGPYRTYFNEVFSMRSPPARTRLINRTLPVRQQEIDARASALLAAEDALRAAIEAYQLGQADLEAVLACSEQLGRQQRALLAAVCQYNHDIADYALAVASPETNGQALVAMLIKPPGDASRPPPSASDTAGQNQPFRAPPLSTQPSEVQPATVNEAVPSGPQQAPQPSGVSKPTPAPPRELVEPPGADEATVAPPPEITPPIGKQEPTPGASKDTSEPAQPTVLERPMVPVPGNRSRPTPRTAYKPLLAPEGAAQAAQPLYPNLVDQKPALRTKQLAMALHWNRSLPEQLGEPVELKQCLREGSVADRRRLIDAYWLVSQRAAEYQVLVKQSELLEQLVALAKERRIGASGSEEMLRLHAARSAIDADLFQAHTNLLESQFELTRCVGQPLDSRWLLPSTAPHAGRYLLKLEAQPRELVESWPLRRLAATIPALQSGLQDRAAAVVQADSARAAATAAYQAGSRPLESVLAAIDRQTTETLAFLATLGAYNQAIAEYALRVLPSGVSSDQLAGCLVVQ